jgi:hypothetical protein
MTGFTLDAMLAVYCKWNRDRAKCTVRLKIMPETRLNLEDCRCSDD